MFVVAGEKNCCNLQFEYYFTDILWKGLKIYVKYKKLSSKDANVYGKGIRVIVLIAVKVFFYIFSFGYMYYAFSCNDLF